MYILTIFGSVTLPVGSPRHTAGTMASQTQLVKLVGGRVYDASGGERLPVAYPFQLKYDCKVTGTSSATLRSTLDELRALRGTTARLYRRRLDNPLVRQWATAQLVSIDYDTEARHSHGLFQPITMNFLVMSQWRGILHGAPWYLDEGHYLDTGLFLDLADRYALTSASMALTISNDGNAPVDDVILTLEAGATPVTGLTVQVGSCHLVWTGTVAANKSLVIDCSPTVRSVYNDGVAAWNGLSLGGSHASNAWCRLEKGDNTVTVERTGGGTDSYITFDFSDGWE